MFHLDQDSERTLATETVRMRRAKRLGYAALLAMLPGFPMGVGLAFAISPEMGAGSGLMEMMILISILVMWPLAYQFLRWRRPKGEAFLEEHFDITGFSASEVWQAWRGG